MAEKIRLEVEKLVPDAIQALPAHIAALKGILPPQNVPGEAADQYKRLLDDLLAALRTARCDTADGIVWLRFGWGGPGLLVSAATAIESMSSAMRADWLAAARSVDESQSPRFAQRTAELREGPESAELSRGRRPAGR